jgi:hypothetical protein
LLVESKCSSREFLRLERISLKLQVRCERRLSKSNSALVPEQYAEKIFRFDESLTVIYIGSKRSRKPILKFYRKDISLLRFETERVGG